VMRLRISNYAYAELGFILGLVIELRISLGLVIVA
jgi:hypothetical protein